MKGHRQKTVGVLCHHTARTAQVSVMQVSVEEMKMSSSGAGPHSMDHPPIPMAIITLDCDNALPGQ